MKILALEREINGADWNDAETLLEQEAHHVFQLYLNDHLREIYFTENKTAVLILETENQAAAEHLLNQLPLVKAGKIRFEVMMLKPYTGYTRIIQN